MIDPLIKLTPIIKLIGNGTKLADIKLTLILLELFCIPIIKSKNNEKLYVVAKNNFLNVLNIIKILLI